MKRYRYRYRYRYRKRRSIHGSSENSEFKQTFDRLASMLTKLGGRAYSMKDDVEGNGDSMERRSTLPGAFHDACR